MGDFEKLCDLISNCNTDVVLKYIRNNAINAKIYDRLFGLAIDDIVSPLGLAIKHGHLLVVKELIDLGFDPTKLCTDTFHTVLPLELACKYQRLDIIRSLHYDHGINLDQFNDSGNTALVQDILNSRHSDEATEVEKTLIQAGASVTVSGLYGESPLSAAIGVRRIELCRYLVSKGADINANNAGQEKKTGLMCFIEKREHIDILRLRIECGTAVNAYDSKGRSVLMSAIANGAETDVIRLLLESGADVNALDKHNKSPLSYAIEYYRHGDTGRVGLIVKLLIKSGADVNALDNDLVSPLMCAAMHCYVDNKVIEFLVGIGADVNAQDKNNKPLIWHAIESCRYVFEKGDRVTLLVKSGADVNVCNWLVSPLMHALITGLNIGAITSMIEAGASVNALDNDRKSPLVCAINSSRFHCGYDDIIKLLVNSGADVNVLDNDSISPLMHALERLNIEVITSMMEAVPRVNVNALDKDNNSPLVYALKRCWLESEYGDIVKLLVNSGADVNVLDNDSISPLMHAAMNNVNVEVVRVLVDSGADVNVLDNNQLSPLMYAVMKGVDIEVVRVLVDSGAEVNTQDNSTKSPLICAIGSHKYRDQSDTVALLISSGADVNVLDNNQLSPLMYAAMNGVDIGVVRVLVDSGAEVNTQDKSNKSPLVHAIEHCQFYGRNDITVLDKDQNNTVNMADYLILSGADVNALDINDEAPLLYALRMSDSKANHRWNHSYESRQHEIRISTVRLLLKSGANINILDKKHKSPLHHAIDAFCDVDILQLLVDSGADVNILDENGDSPLMYELKKNTRVEVALLFLASEGDVCARNQDNVCPLTYALGKFDDFQFSIKQKHTGEMINLVDMLAESATDVNGLLETLPKSYDLHSTFNIIRTLCSKGADIEAKDENGNTVLHQVMMKISECCCEGCFNLVYFLIVELNLSLWDRNSANQTPFRALRIPYAREVREILKLCVQAGYTPSSDEMADVRQLEEEFSLNIKRTDVISLQDICCFSIRRALGRRLPAAVGSLPIPEKLIQRVKLTHSLPLPE